MKKIFLAIVATILSISAFSQSGHLTFKGIQIDGTLNQFVSNMKSAGFFSAGQKDGTVVLKGDFAGYKGCYIIVSTLRNKDLVSRIVVMFPECSNWSILDGNYSKLKEMLTTKYGEPSESVEEFQNSYAGRNDDFKMHELKMDRCHYQTIFQTDKGYILLRLMHDNYGKCYVLLAYYDKINGLEVEAAAMNDL